MRLMTKVLLVALACSMQVYSQQPTNDEEIRVETSLVAVPTKVTDRQNKNVVGLKKEDFRLYKNGVPQDIESFEDADAPFTIALVLDVSDSTATKLKSITAAAIAFLDQLRPKDRVIIFNFDQNLVKVADGTVKDLSNIQNSIAFSQTGGGGTSLYDSVFAVNENYLRRISGKKAMIIFTDGIDTQSVHQTFKSSARAAEEAGVLIYSIQYETVQDLLNTRPGIRDRPFGANVEFVTARGERLPAAYKRGTLYLNSLATGTGGKFFFADTTKNLSRVFAKIAKEQLYNLSYYPANQTGDDRRRKIKVNVNVPQAIVEPRKTYIFKRTKNSNN